MSDPRTILGLDPQRFLSDGDAVAEWRPNDDDRWAGPTSPEEWAALLGCPTHPMPYDDMDWVAWFREGADGAGRDGIDRAARAVLGHDGPPTDAEIEDAALDALLDDHRDEHGELREEYAA